ncbi:MAG: DNA-3-methyladenine glycosylase [bacterium]
MKSRTRGKDVARKKNAARLERDFYHRLDVVQISRELIGKVLLTKIDSVITGGVIVETEAYGGALDRASHAYGNRRTARTESMFLPGGHAYIYLCYGMHHLFNVVTGPKGIPAAVLIRALEPQEGVETMLRRRRIKKIEPRLTSGPGALAQALGMNRSHDKANLCGATIWIEDNGAHVSEGSILASPRVGVHYAGEDAALPWRFRLRGSLWTSSAL